MKIVCPPGYRADFPPYDPNPFWSFGENVRFRMGWPETIGLTCEMQDSANSFAPVTIGTPATTQLSAYADASKLYIGDGTTVYLVDMDAGSVTALAAPDAGATGFWWFAATEAEIICGRSNKTGKTYAIDRALGTISLVGGTIPNGNVAAGIVNGILVIAGTDGFAGDGPDMVVRWSARRTDPSGDGTNFGFEDWTPSDINSSGEFLLDRGEEIVGGGVTDFGFLVWTDSGMTLFSPRTDLYTFNKIPFSERGLMATQTWCEGDGRVWFYDNSRSLCYFDGGSIQTIPCPIRRLTLDAISEVNVDDAWLTFDPNFSEVRLHYTDRWDSIRELVYNVAEDSWYLFALKRAAWVKADSKRPSVGVDTTGALRFYDMRTSVDESIAVPAGLTVTDPINPPDQDVLPSVGDSWVYQPSGVPDEYEFFLATNRILVPAAAMEAMRARAFTIAHITMQLPRQETGTDAMDFEVHFFGDCVLDEIPDPIDKSTKNLGVFRREMRGGGKAVQAVMHAKNIRTQIRFGEIDGEVDQAGKR